MWVLAEAIEWMELGHNDIGYATIVQLFKSLHQFLLDKGSWKVAALLTLVEDPYEPEVFGGEDSELAILGGKLKAESDLWEKVHKSGPGDSQKDQSKEDGKDGKDPDAQPGKPGRKKG